MAWNTSVICIWVSLFKGKLVSFTRKGSCCWNQAQIITVHYQIGLNIIQILDTYLITISWVDANGTILTLAESNMSYNKSENVLTCPTLNNILDFTKKNHQVALLVRKKYKTNRKVMVID